MVDQGLVALLPMKAHSERVSGKNFRLLGGRPLFRWMLDALLSIPAIGTVVINTDARALLEWDPAIRRERVLIRDRRAEICGDLVSMNRIIADDVSAVVSPTYLMTHATNPFLSATTMLSALAAYREAYRGGKADSLFSVNRLQTRLYRGDGSAVNHDPHTLLRTQDLEPWFEENSCLYIFSQEGFARTGARIGDRPLLFETPRLESVDIDEPDDWRLAEAIAGPGATED
ncbi:MAG: acylneuraminate cytidylyltransferase family protein [Gammaproteobacteria bacterium]